MKKKILLLIAPIFLIGCGVSQLDKPKLVQNETQKKEKEHKDHFEMLMKNEQYVLELQSYANEASKNKFEDYKDSEWSEKYLITLRKAERNLDDFKKTDFYKKHLNEMRDSVKLEDLKLKYFRLSYEGIAENSRGKTNQSVKISLVEMPQLIEKIEGSQ